MIRQAWYCDLCGLDTEVVHMHEVDALEVKKHVLRVHRKNSPECPANDIGPIRFRGQTHDDNATRDDLRKSQQAAEKAAEKAGVR